MDMLIKLYGTDFSNLANPGADIRIRKPIGPEHGVVHAWVANRFGLGWASELQVALGNRPSTVWIAVRGAELLAFACYDATARGFFGPIGVAEPGRGQGVGTALLRASLHEMRTAGYGYAIAGGVGAPAFFSRAAAAIEIPDSTPGLYLDQLRF
jgi:GNAT superfamily N-acetyltransferase